MTLEQLEEMERVCKLAELADPDAKLTKMFRMLLDDAKLWKNMLSNYNAEAYKSMWGSPQIRYSSPYLFTKPK